MYRLEGPYILKCDDMHEFNYMTERKVWHAGHCCGWWNIPNKWQNPTGKTDIRLILGAGLVRNGIERLINAKHSCVFTNMRMVAY
jgi:hypothetical protein